jgi:hypothetical protein
MKVVIGPVLARSGGFSYDIWQSNSGVKSSFIYRRVDDARHARDFELTVLRAIACETVAAFIAELTLDPLLRDQHVHAQWWG